MKCFKNRLLWHLLFLFVFNTQAVTWERRDVEQPLPKKELTFVVYIAGDNNLWEFIEPDIVEMETVGSNEKMNVVAYVNTTFPGEEKVSRKLVVEQGITFQDGPDMQKDSGDPATVIDALAWAHEKFPADRFVVVFWNHGSGSLNRQKKRQTTTLFGKPWGAQKKINGRAVCYDDATGSYLTDADLRSALAYVCEHYRNGDKFDIVAFDACLMADIEVAYAIKPYAHYMVASQQSIPGEGYGYQYVLDWVVNNNITTENLAKEMIQAYKQTYDWETQDYTLSAIDLSQLDALTRNLDFVSRLLMRLLHGTDKDAVYEAMWESTANNNANCFDEKAYIDLGTFYSTLIEKLEGAQMESRFTRRLLSLILRLGLRRISNCVIDQVTGDYFDHCCGLSIYFDQNEIDATYKTTHWAQNTWWLDLLNLYTRI